MADVLTYNELIEQASNFNSRLAVERAQRFPFIDQQTGVAQRPSYNWFTKLQRMKGKNFAQVYAYPEKRWKRKKRIQTNYKPYNSDAPYSALDRGDIVSLKPYDVVSAENSIAAVRTPIGESQLDDYDSRDRISIGNNPALEEDNSKYYYYDDDDLSDPPDAGELENDSDVSDYEDTFSRSRRKRSKNVRGGGNRKRVRVSTPSTDRSSEKHANYVPSKPPSNVMSSLIDDVEKQFFCPAQNCGNRYKTATSLKYHCSQQHGLHLSDVSLYEKPIEKGIERKDEIDLISTRYMSEEAIRKRNKTTYCDFCLGDTTYNKATDLPEELVSCADCGRSGHPSCIKFTANMLISVKKYPWQCIECKSCWLCGTQDNDDQLLFCDDCDRGYHMYCLTPPLSQPPDGNWSCHLCIREFHSQSHSSLQSPRHASRNPASGHQMKPNVEAYSGSEALSRPLEPPPNPMMAMPLPMDDDSFSTDATDEPPTLT